MSISAFLSAAILLTLMPGPDILFVITQSVIRGRRAGIVFAAGLCSGLVVHTLAVCLGVAVLISQSATAFTLLNPKVVIFFLAFFPQFIRPGSDPAGQMLLLGLIFMIQAFLIFSLVAILADRLCRKLNRYPRISRVLNLVEASVCCIIAVSIVMV